IGKWHLAPPSGETAAPAAAPPTPAPPIPYGRGPTPAQRIPPLATRGPVKPEHRGGFLDLWEGANELEWTSHAYEGDLYDGEGHRPPLSRPLPRLFYARPRAAIPALARREVPVAADALLPRSASPERPGHLRRAARVRRPLPERVRAARPAAASRHLAQSAW